MPQKQIFNRPPVLNTSCSFPSAGTVRTADKRVSRLYRQSNRYIERPCLWEGLFRLACIVKNKPTEEPVAARILSACSETEDGSFAGSFSDQVCIARAALALYEYNTDRSVLLRLAEWLRYVEIEFDSVMLQDGILYRPADLMEFLVRYYQASGVRSALRLCARVRAESFDWITALHTFQQSIPIRTDKTDRGYPIPAVRPEEIEYDQKEKLINHSEMLADGIRYTVFAGLFSGHGQDLSSGRTAWAYLEKHHHALCGGTTGDPYLSGNAADKAVNNLALCAWAEAFASQLLLPDSLWAAEELTRIAHNGLEDCLNRDPVPGVQFVNTVREEEASSDDPVALYGRLTRAVASVFHHAVMMTENGIRINCLLQARYMLMVQKQTLILHTDCYSVTFSCRKQVSAQAEIFVSSSCRCTAELIREGNSHGISGTGTIPESGKYLRTGEVWTNGDRIELHPDGNILSADTHHRGKVYTRMDRLLCIPAEANGFARAACGDPVTENGKPSVLTSAVGKWPLKDGHPADIPVLPEGHGEPVLTALEEYASCRQRITMIPRVR